MNSSILKPSTGTNYYYAQKHGEPIRNVLDNVLAGMCESYQPTGATNSLDAAEMLCKGTAPDFSRPVAAEPAPAQAKKEYAPQPADYGSTFGTSPRTPQAPPPTPPPVQEPPVDMEWALAPGHGWSAEDSRRQNQALYYCGGDDHTLRQVVNTGFNESIRLDESSFNRSGIATGLFMGAAAAGVAGLALVASPLVGLALVGGAVVATFEGIHQVDWSHRDHNNSQILRDMATRLDQADRHMVGERPVHHGNYANDFTLAR